ncbi:MAG: hypothetical protein ACLQVL_36755 [Terriglobia bacterium]
MATQALEDENNPLDCEMYLHCNALKPGRNRSRKRLSWDVRFALWCIAAILLMFMLGAIAAQWRYSWNCFML